MDGFVPKRRGILEHLRTGRVTMAEYASLDVILLLADAHSGIWWGCSFALAEHCNAGNNRHARDILRSLEEKGYIKRIRSHGQRGNYPVLVDKYAVTMGVLTGKRLNAKQSTTWQHPKYDSGTDSVSRRVTEGVTDYRTDPVTLSISKEVRSEEVRQIERERNSQGLTHGLGAESKAPPPPPTPSTTDKLPAAGASGFEAQTLSKQLFELMGSPDALASPTVVSEWNQQAIKALALAPNSTSLQAALSWVFTGGKGSNFWLERITGADHPMAMLAKNSDKIVQAHAAAIRQVQRKPPTQLSEAEQWLAKTKRR